MKKLVCLLLVWVLLLPALEAKADIVLLAHGYLSDASTWESSGISTILEKNQWQRTSILITGPGGVHRIPATGSTTTQPKNKQFLAELPSTAPIGIQADHLQAMLWFLSAKYPKEKIVLVGHSVGGVVARLTLVRSKIPNITALITIASPHLGTPLAEEALDATSSPWPVEIVKDFFGGNSYQTLKYSRGLYIDIVRPWPGTLLHWLNHQPHPPIHYVSIVRSQPFVLWGDILVPGASQDMNNLPSLAGKSTRHVTVSGHGLNPGDGVLLAQILETLP